KVMVPVGVPAPGATAVTVAENVNCAPTAGVPLVRAGALTVVAAWLTVSATALEGALARNAPPGSPVYVAVNEWAPTPKADVLKTAVPPAPKDTVPMSVAPSKN